MEGFYPGTHTLTPRSLSHSVFVHTCIEDRMLRKTGTEYTHNHQKGHERGKNDHEYSQNQWSETRNTDHDKM